MSPPKIENTPGITWRKRKAGWEARWAARTDLVQRGFTPKSCQLWCGAEPGDLDVAFIIDRCNALQTEMLVWGRGGIPVVSTYDRTLDSLIDCYQTDKDSPFRKLRYFTREHYANLCKSLKKFSWEGDGGVTLVLGATEIRDIKARLLLKLHEHYLETGRIAMGHSVLGMLRIITGFGMTILEDEQCTRLSTVLSNMRFKMAKHRESCLNAEQATAIRLHAHKEGRPSIAMGQAFQFELTLRQKDVIGEWVPIIEPGISDVLDGNKKWLRGLRWEEIGHDEKTGADLILTHITSKRQKEIRIDLRNAPMVMEELAIVYGPNFTRADLPASGAIILAERHGMPWTATEFRRYWRKFATACGIPKSVRNMDTRAGAITEATDSGADLEHVRQAATHSDIGMTQKYSRGSEQKIAGVMHKRVAFRENKG